MAHNLEILKDGTASMFSGEGILPWHGLGTVVDGKATAAEALQLAHLDWEVEKQPMSFGPNNTSYPGLHAVVRVTDQKPLGHVGDDYHLFQNHEAFDFMDNVTDAGSGEAMYTSAGSLKGGKVIFLCAKIGDVFNVAGEDAHNMYLVMRNAHNGKQALSCGTTVIRAVCDNTVTLGLRTAKSKFTIRHKSTLEGKVQEAREALKLSFKYADAFEKEVEKLMQVQITKDQFHKIAEQIIPESKFQHEKDVQALMDTFEFESTINDTNAKGTGWGAYNAVTFFGDHKKKYHTPESRFLSLSDGFAEGIRDKAHGLILAAA